jgi:hypothetical protein
VYKFICFEDGLDCPKYAGTNVNIILLYILYYIGYLLVPWSRIFLDKPTSSQLVKKFPHFMEPKASLLHSQVPAPVPILSPDQ